MPDQDSVPQVTKTNQGEAHGGTLVITRDPGVPFVIPGIAAPGACAPQTITVAGSNGDEDDGSLQAPFIGNFHKGLDHDSRGVVTASAYNTLRDVLRSRDHAQFRNIPLKLGRKLTNPQCGLGTDAQIPEPQYLLQRAAPKVTSDEAAAEAIELYWMALLRDKSFQSFDADADVAAAAAELTSITAFSGPRDSGQVTPATVFRGCTPGDLSGGYLSQFLLRSVPYGTLTISQRQQTVPAGFDHLTTHQAWLDAQNGKDFAAPADDPNLKFYIRNMRDLAEYVHRDALYEAYLNACLILLFDPALAAPLNPGNPYVKTPSREGSQFPNQVPFGTFGGPHILSLVTEAATRALKAVWWEKWFVHRRLRPEAYAGLVHHTVVGENGTKTPFLAAGNPVLGSQALARIIAANGTGLLPQAFPEGSPTHPAYGAGHATVAGACVTILKAFFDEDHVLPEVVAPNAGGTALVKLGAPPTLTVGGELNKVAANVAIGRNMAGVHWRSDYRESIRLGELVAMHMLTHQRHDYNEQDFFFVFTTFAGERVRVNRDGVFFEGGAEGGRPYLQTGKF